MLGVSRDRGVAVSGRRNERIAVASGHAWIACARF